MRVTNRIPLECSLFLPVDAVNCVQTLKVKNSEKVKGAGAAVGEEDDEMDW
jgi:hypothetical protein